MTNEPYIYDPLKRLGFAPTPSTKLAYSNSITFADEHDLTSVWELAKSHHYHDNWPFKDAVEHLLRNPRNVSALNLLHTLSIPSSWATDDSEEIVGQVKNEEVTGYVCVCPVDKPTMRTNLIQVRIPLLVHNAELTEEQLANLVYECLHQYCVAKTNTTVPTKLEVTIWLHPLETKLFKIVVGYLEALFQDSYLPLRTSPVSYTVNNPNDKPLEVGKPNQSSKALLIKQRKNLNNPHLHQPVQHVVTFPRLPGPIK